MFTSRHPGKYSAPVFIAPVVSALLVAPVFMNKAIPLLALIPSFLASTVAGAVLGILALKLLKRADILNPEGSIV